MEYEYNNDTKSNINGINPFSTRTPAVVHIDISKFQIHLQISFCLMEKYFGSTNGLLRWRASEPSPPQKGKPGKRTVRDRTVRKLVSRPSLTVLDS